MIEFHTKLWDATGEFISDAMLGPYSLADEIAHLPTGWKLEMTRIDKGDE